MKNFLATSPRRHQNPKPHSPAFFGPSPRAPEAAEGLGREGSAGSGLTLDHRPKLWSSFYFLARLQTHQPRQPHLPRQPLFRDEPAVKI